jgi:hypothetical protein
VHAWWHEYRATAGDVNTTVVSCGVDTDQQLRVMPHRDAGYHWVMEEAYAVQWASFRTGVKDTLILVAKSLGRLHKRLCRQGRKGDTPCGGPRCALQPSCPAHEVERRGGEDVLQARFGVADVATLA